MTFLPLCWIFYNHKEIIIMPDKKEEEIITNFDKKAKKVYVVHKSNGFGIASFICGILSIFSWWIIFGTLAIIFAAIGSRKKEEPWSTIGFILALAGGFVSPTVWVVFSQLLP